MGLARRSKPKGPVIEVTPDMLSGSAFEAFPNLFEFMCLTVWPDGSRRETGTVMFFTESGAWKAWLHDRDGCEGCFVSSDSLDSLLVRLEEMLSVGGGDWRPDRKQSKRGG